MTRHYLIVYAALFAVLGCLALVANGCGGTSENPEVSAAAALLAEEKTVLKGARKAEREGANAYRRGLSCATSVCYEAAGVLIDASTARVRQAARDLRRIHRELNRYSLPVLREAYRR